MKARTTAGVTMTMIDYTHHACTCNSATPAIPVRLPRTGEPLSMTTCTTEFHAALKLDATRWALLSYVGVQVIEADDDEPEERLELRNCACGSTLCRRVA